MPPDPESVDRSVPVDTSNSPHVQLRPIPLTAVALMDRIWAPRLARLSRSTIPSLHDRMEEAGRLQNLRRAAGRSAGPFRGPPAADADVALWVEAASWSLTGHLDRVVGSLLDAVVEDLLAAQQSDGYLDSYFSGDRSTARWSNVRGDRELFCAGHVIQAGIARARATGDRDLLEAAVRLADHVDATFGPDGLPGADAHPQIEMALVELSREAGERRYLELAGTLVDRRGSGPSGGSVRDLDHVPLRDMKEIAGPPERAVALASAAADLFAETGDAALGQAAARLWRSARERRTYITGGLGTTQLDPAAAEAFGATAFGSDFDLPNRTASADTCAAVASVLWNWRLLLVTGQAEHADDLETALYNAALAGIGLDGTSFFATNPLQSGGEHRRQQWFDEDVCPANLARLLAIVPGLVYCVSPGGLWVNLYAAGTATLRIGDVGIRIEQETDYPWDGEVAIRITPERLVAFDLHVRIPAWCREATVRVAGSRVEAEVRPGSYVTIAHEWDEGDEVRLSMAMPAGFIAAHPSVRADAGRLAIRRGPLVYCLEGADNPGADVRDVALDAAGPLAVEWVDDLGGYMTVRGTGMVMDPTGWAGRLYRPIREVRLSSQPSSFGAVPYHLWANRQPGSMTVWPLAWR